MFGSHTARTRESTDKPVNILLRLVRLPLAVATTCINNQINMQNVLAHGNCGTSESCAQSLDHNEPGLIFPVKTNQDQSFLLQRTAVTSTVTVRTSPALLFNGTRGPALDTKKPQPS